MNSRERAFKTINHQIPDRIPVDLGTTNCTTMTRKAYESLKKLLGVEKKIRVMQKNFQVVFIDEEVLSFLGIDTVVLIRLQFFLKILLILRAEKNFIKITLVLSIECQKMVSIMIW